MLHDVFTKHDLPVPTFKIEPRRLTPSTFSVAQPCKQQDRSAVSSHSNKVNDALSANSNYASHQGSHEVTLLVTARAMLTTPLKRVKKTAFRRCWNIAPPQIRLKEVCIATKSSAKYLGITLDSRMTFKPHFRTLLPRALGAPL
ncbi:hypothetical protein M0804_013112 [Polistes exclamans]|nr:hypothetical protein M0804_013112 [Polistes exclamans]